MAEALIPFGDLNSGFTRICSEYREAQQKALDQLQELLATHRKYPDGATVFVSVGRFKDVPGLTILSARFDPYQDHKYLLAEGEKVGIVYNIQSPDGDYQAYGEKQVFLTAEQAGNSNPYTGTSQKLTGCYLYEIFKKDGSLVAVRKDKGRYSHAVISAASGDLSFCKTGWMAEKKQAAKQRKNQAAFVVELQGEASYV